MKTPCSKTFLKVLAATLVISASAFAETPFPGGGPGHGGGRPGGGFGGGGHPGGFGGGPGPGRPGGFGPGPGRVGPPIGGPVFRPAPVIRPGFPGGFPGRPVGPVVVRPGFPGGYPGRPVGPVIRPGFPGGFPGGPVSPVVVRPGFPGGFPGGYPGRVYGPRPVLVTPRYRGIPAYGPNGQPVYRAPGIGFRTPIGRIVFRPGYRYYDDRGVETIGQTYLGLNGQSDYDMIPVRECGVDQVQIGSQVNDSIIDSIVVFYQDGTQHQVDVNQYVEAGAYTGQYELPRWSDNNGTSCITNIAVIGRTNDARYTGQQALVQVLGIRR
jgi:hypothetical protein